MYTASIFPRVSHLLLLICFMRSVMQKERCWPQMAGRVCGRHCDKWRQVARWSASNQLGGRFCATRKTQPAVAGNPALQHCILHRPHLRLSLLLQMVNLNNCGSCKQAEKPVLACFGFVRNTLLLVSCKSLIKHCKNKDDSCSSL